MTNLFYVNIVYIEHVVVKELNSWYSLKHQWLYVNIVNIEHVVVKELKPWYSLQASVTNLFYEHEYTVYGPYLNQGVSQHMLSEHKQH